MRPTFDPEFFAANRSRFLAELGADAALLFASPHHLRNGDAEYRYRQSSDVFYLTGWTDPECAVLLRPGADQPFILFVQPKNPELEVWTGVREGPDGAVARYGADAAFPIEELGPKLPSLLMGYRNLHYRFADDPARDQLLVTAIASARKLAKKNGLDVPDAFFDPSRLLHELRLIKCKEEVDLLRGAAEITRHAHTRAMRMTRPGVMEYEIESEIDHTFRRLGGEGPGYGTIVGGGVNATVLHYVANNDDLKAGELVCVDAGCEYGLYCADVTRTWPVSGTFTPAQRELYQLVLDAQLAAIEECRPGNTFRALHDAATRVLTEGMVRLGLLEGDVDEIIEKSGQKKYFMHGTGHWLGLDVHDTGAYYTSGESRVLAPGMVTTIEPGLYVPANDEDAPERFRGLGIRIEDDVLITAEGCDVLTAGIPKQIDEIEALVGKGL